MSEGFREAVLSGLSRRPRAIPCRFLYDDRGSLLFERITRLEEYYLTRTEIELLGRHGAAIARLCGPGRRVVEFGAGAMRKTRLLLAMLDRPAAYLPVDVAAGMLNGAARDLAADHPGLVVQPIEADFTRPFALPPMPGEGALLGFFPGSTIGNLAPTEARAFLERCARLLGPGGLLLVGVDLVKEPRVLCAAYDDREGVTAAFTRNLLLRANRELGADFDVDAFDHHVWWNARESRIEIRLVCRTRHQVRIGDRHFRFDNGDWIHAEDCYKYTVRQFHWLAGLGGFTPTATWVDEAGLFSLHLLAVA